MNIKYCFLILHFKDDALTRRAVDSIKKLNDIIEAKIIIVDNGSGNGSGEKLQNYYCDDSLVDVLLLKENYGFSKGNNIGYRHILNKYSPKYIIVMNNDILFPDSEFLNMLDRLYHDTKFYVAGPDVFVPQRYWHSSPLRDHHLTDEEFEVYKQHWSQLVQEYQKDFSLKTLKSYLLEEFRDTIALKLFYKTRRILLGNPSTYNKRLYNCVLQGSCIILSENFIKTNENVFVPETFLYEEENILTQRCISNNWDIVYFPELQVFHTCQGSTLKKKQSYSNFKKKKISEIRHVQEAIVVYDTFRMENKHDGSN